MFCDSTEVSHSKNYIQLLNSITIKRFITFLIVIVFVVTGALVFFYSVQIPYTYKAEYMGVYALGMSKNRYNVMNLKIEYSSTNPYRKAYDIEVGDSVYLHTLDYKKSDTKIEGKVIDIVKEDIEKSIIISVLSDIKKPTFLFSDVIIVVNKSFSLYSYFMSK